MPTDINENEISEAVMENGVLKFNVGKLKPQNTTKRVSIT
jgi:HSP20 family molecular chaperone IbpA